jgi:hypothetical protein
MNADPTLRVKYVFMDIVGYTRQRSVEAQVDILTKLNEIVRQSMELPSVGHIGGILIPTGDGMCLGVTDTNLPFDTHLHFALAVLERIERHNNVTTDRMRAFKVRIGITENVDNLVTDINNHQNLAGAGINLCSRIMDIADGGQILMSQNVYETLAQREKYLHAFREYKAIMKHGAIHAVYQFIQNGHPGLSLDTPRAFAPIVETDHPLTEFEALYFFHAIRNQPLFLSMGDQDTVHYPAVVLLWNLASDSQKQAHASAHFPASFTTYGEGQIPIDQAYAYYSKLHFWVTCDLAGYYCQSLSPRKPLFETHDLPYFHLVNAQGREKFRIDAPGLFALIQP